MNPYIYMFVRRDLSVPQQIVQTAHAVDEITQRHKSEGNYMVLCGAKNEQHLTEVSEWLGMNDVDHHLFFEPDVNQYTAIATKPLRGNERKALKRFQLMT